MTTNTLSLLERCMTPVSIELRHSIWFLENTKLDEAGKKMAQYEVDNLKSIKADLEAAIAAERSEANPIAEWLAEDKGANWVEETAPAERSKEQAKPQQETVAWYAAALGDFSLEPPDDFDFLQTTGVQWRPLVYGDVTPQPLKPLSDEVLSFLMGEGELEGLMFGEKHPSRKGSYWWRSVIRERAIEAKLGVGT